MGNEYGQGKRKGKDRRGTGKEGRDGMEEEVEKGGRRRGEGRARRGERRGMEEGEEKGGGGREGKGRRTGRRWKENSRPHGYFQTSAPMVSSPAS